MRERRASAQKSLDDAKAALAVAQHWESSAVIDVETAGVALDDAVDDAVDDAPNESLRSASALLQESSMDKSSKSKSKKPSTTKSGVPEIILYVRVAATEDARFKAAFERSSFRRYADWVRHVLWEASEPPRSK